MSCVLALVKILNTTAFRLSLAIIAAFALCASAMVGYIFPRANDLLTRQVLQTIDAEARGLKEQFDAGGLLRLRNVLRERTVEPGDNLYFLKGPDGRKLAGNLSRVPPEVALSAPGGVFTYARRASPGSNQNQNQNPDQDQEVQERLAAGVIIAVPGGAVLLVGRDTQEQRQFVQTVKWAMYGGLTLLFLIALGGGLLASRQILKRIEAVTDTSQRIMEGDLSERVALNGSGDELDRLSYSLNAMLERIEQLMAGLREVSDNIAHDLKTPLNRLRNRAEAALRDHGNLSAYEEGLAGIIDEADDLIKTFNALLSIARLEAGDLAHDLEMVDLNAVARDVGELYEPVAEEQGFQLNVKIGDDLFINANRQLIGQAIANLLDNAIKYAAIKPDKPPPSSSRKDISDQTDGGTSGWAPGLEGAIATDAAGHRNDTIAAPRNQIDLIVERRGMSARIIVGDHGQGIDAADRKRVLQRFVRLEVSRSKPGSGLGLSLVSAVMRLHGGRIVLEDNSPGLRVVITLPGAQTAAVGALDAVGNEQSSLLASNKSPASDKSQSKGVPAYASRGAGQNTS